MDSNLLFTSALGLQAPWQVTDIRLSAVWGGKTHRVTV